MDINLKYEIGQKVFLIKTFSRYNKKKKCKLCDGEKELVLTNGEKIECIKCRGNGYINHNSKRWGMARRGEGQKIKGISIYLDENIRINYILAPGVDVYLLEDGDENSYELLCGSKKEAFDACRKFNKLIKEKEKKEFEFIGNI